MEVNEIYEKCTNCGLCLNKCLSYRDYDRGFIKDISKNLFQDRISMEDALDAYKCTFCGYCLNFCPFFLNPPELLLEVRNAYCASGRGPLSYHQPLFIDKRINFFSLYDGSALDKRDYPKSAERIFFPGCSLSAYRPDLVLKISRHMKDTLVMRHECCGKPLKVMGMKDRFKEFNASILQRLEALEPREIILACPTCYSILNKEIKFAEVLFVTEALQEGLEEASYKVNQSLGTIAIHDSCPFRKEPQLFDFVREFVDTIYDGGRVELVNSREKLMCCGAGGAVNFAYEDLAQTYSQARIDDSTGVGADALITFCASCAVQFGPSSDVNGIRICHGLDLLDVDATPDHGRIYRRSRGLFSGHRAFVNLLRLSLQI